MSHGLLSKETNSYNKTSDFHKNRYKAEIIQMTMLTYDYASSVLLPSTTRYSKLYGVGYTDYSIFAILSRLYRVEDICYPE